MAFEVLKESTTLHKQVGTRLTRNGEEVPYFSAKVYSKGDVVQEGDIAASIVSLYDSGDERIRTLIKKIGETPAKPKAATKKSATKKKAAPKTTTKKVATESKAKAKDE